MFDNATRATWDMDLPRPGATLEAHASVDAPRPDDVEERLWLEVEALGQSAPDVDTFRGVLVRVVACRARTTGKLASLFLRAEATMRERRAVLLDAGRVTRGDGEVWSIV